jgi:Flp pilus assembly protein TadG
MGKQKRGVRIMRIKSGSQKGAAMVEFALILIPLLILTFGLIEFGLLMYNQQVLTNAAREGARYGIVMTDPLVDGDERDQTSIQGVVATYVLNHLVSLGSGGGTLTSSASALTGVGYCGTSSSGVPLTVSVTYDYAFLVMGNFIPGLDSLTLSSTAVMNCE